MFSISTRGFSCPGWVASPIAMAVTKVNWFSAARQGRVGVVKGGHSDRQFFTRNIH